MKLKEFFGSDDVYVIAEISQNHDGSLGQAHAFIDAVAKTGADAIKFQTHIASEESTIYEPFRVNFSYCDKTRYDYWKRMEFTKEQWIGLKEHAEEKGLEFLSSPFSIAALEMLDEIGVPAWKFGSGEIFNDRLYLKALETGKPVLLSTGLCTFSDIQKRIDLAKKYGNDVLLFQCTTAYPTQPEEIHLNLIQEYRDRFGCPIGLSDHSATIYPAIAAVTLGARAVEVHVTMSRDMFGPDVKASVTIDELKQLVDGCKYIKTVMDHPAQKTELGEKEQHLKNIFSKSLYAKRPIKAGEVINKDDLAIKKPNDGIDCSEFENVVGCIAAKDLEADEVLRWEKIKK